MTGGDLGISVYDGATTWVLFGDTMGTAAAWQGGADATGYFSGTNAASGLCGGLGIVSVAGSGIFAPDPVEAQSECHLGPLPSWGLAFWSCSSESVGDFVLQ